MEEGAHIDQRNWNIDYERWNIGEPHNDRWSPYDWDLGADRRSRMQWDRMSNWWPGNQRNCSAGHPSEFRNRDANWGHTDKGDRHADWFQQQFEFSWLSNGRNRHQRAERIGYNIYFCICANGKIEASATNSWLSNWCTKRECQGYETNGDTDKYQRSKRFHLANDSTNESLLGNTNLNGDE